MKVEFKHDPVMLREVIDGLNVKENGTYIDATVGGAGHSIEIAKLLNADGLLIGIDQDPEALKAAAKRLSGFECSVKLVSSNFSDITDVVDHVGVEHVDGILMDIGVSSYQLDESSRGFTYREDVPLDMRMNPSVEITAAYIVNKEPEDKLCQIIGQYGEETGYPRSPSLFTILADYLAKLVLRFFVYYVCCRNFNRWVHSHVQRHVFPVGKSPG